MRISYRVLGLGMVLKLAGVGQALGQNTLSPGYEDSLKGEIWTKTAQRIWADAKPKQPQPAAWATGTAFGNWTSATPADPSEIGLLRRDVISRIGKGQPGHPAEVASAIVAVVIEKNQSKTGASLRRVDPVALQADLAAFLPVAVAAPPSAALPTTTAPKATAALPADHRDTIPHTAAPPPASVQVISPIRYFGLSAGQAGSLLALLGLGLGAGAMYWLGPKRRRPHAHSGQQTSSPTTYPSPASPTMTEEEEARLRLQIKQLEKRVSELEALQPRKAVKTAPPLAAAPPPIAEPAPAAHELSIEEQVGAAPVAASPARPATRYGPVQETPFVEERKIVDAPLPQLALMLTVNPKNPDQATFTLNPQVDQARLIGDGLTRLQKFFDYDLPATGRITSVAAGAKGMLQRHADGWQVVERARLLIG